MADLVLQEAYHAHAADNVALIVPLTVAEAYHAHAIDALIAWSVEGKLSAQLSPLSISANTGAATKSDLYLSDMELSGHSGASTSETLSLPSLSLNQYGLYSLLSAMETAGTDEIYCNSIKTNEEDEDPPNLPVIELDANTADFLSTPRGRYSSGVLLPGLTLSTQAGSHMSGEIVAPVFSSSTASGFFFLNTGDYCYIPILSASGDFGPRCGLYLRVGPIKITADGATRIGELCVDLPPISLSASGYGPNSGSLSANLPPVSLDVALSFVNEGSLSLSMPSIKLSATGRLVDYGELSVSLPGVLVDSATGHQGTVSVEVDMPTLAMLGLGTGSGSTSRAGYVFNTNRFYEYVLKHTR